MNIPHYINGKKQEGGSRTLIVTSPWTGEGIGEVRLADADTVTQVVAVAQTAFALWSQVPVKDRVQPLFRFKALCEKHLTELSEMVSRENGKTVAEAQAGIEKGLECVEFACSLPQLSTGELLEVGNGVDCYTRRYPVGVCIGITPFNFPAMVPLWMFPLAIACGNTFILKPSEQVPMTSVRLAELCTEAGLPDGVFNVLHGDREVVELLLDHPGVAAGAFVGSTPVAKAVYQRGTLAGKRVLALGGAKNHLVVVPDADPMITARNAVSSATGCAGQRCMAASVLIGVGDCNSVLDAIEAEMRKIRPGCEMGAIISEKAKERIVGYIDRAEQEGATIRVDGRNPAIEGKSGGYYVGPTLIDQLTPESSCVNDEIFGPVLSVLRVNTLDEALAIENANPYGNAASIYTTNGATARYFEQRASAGMVGVNIGVPVPREPFSFGGWNDSRFGNGDITGKDGIAFWTKLKKTTVKWTLRAGQNWMS
jgi:malonate-semialdehyde dehydrogenase (acetylating)/methylmalonate-semialdehyde dehydrogenase